MVGDVKAHVVTATVVVSCRYLLPVLKLDKFFSGSNVIPGRGMHCAKRQAAVTAPEDKV